MNPYRDTNNNNNNNVKQKKSQSQRKSLTKQIRKKKIFIKISNNDANVLPVNNNVPNYRTKGKVNHSTLSQLINTQNKQLQNKNSKTKPVVSCQRNAANANNNNTTKKQQTGIDAIQAMKKSQKVKDIVSNKNSFYVTSKLIKKKESKSIVDKKYGLFQKQIQILHNKHINTMGINWKRGFKYGGLYCDTCIDYYGND